MVRNGQAWLFSHCYKTNPMSNVNYKHKSEELFFIFLPRGTLVIDATHQ